MVSFVDMEIIAWSDAIIRNVVLAHAEIIAAIFGVHSQRYRIDDRLEVVVVYVKNATVSVRMVNVETVHVPFLKAR